MHTHNLALWRHDHDFLTDAERDAARRTRLVVYLTLVTMIGELAVGWLAGSMALLADGWHMGSHAGALGISVFAYGFARRHAATERFTFGTGKVLALAGYTSAIILGAGAVWMLVVAGNRLFHPVAIHYEEAMVVAVLGLSVNLLSAWLLRDGHHHAHGHDHGDDQGPAHHEHHHDHNLRAAYLHVLADSVTSVLAIMALAAGLWFGWAFLDPVMGLAGAALVGWWAYGLAVQSGRTLLDAEHFEGLRERVRTAVEAGSGDRVCDLHLWRLGPAGVGCIVAVVTHEAHGVEHYRERLAGIHEIAHLTVEVNHCQGPECRPPGA